LTPCDCVLGNFPSDIPADSIGIPRNSWACEDYSEHLGFFCRGELGACCFDYGVIGADRQCYNLKEHTDGQTSGCIERGGVWLGAGTTCDNTYADGPCYGFQLFDPGGPFYQSRKRTVCCLPDGSCIGAKSQTCSDYNGTVIYPDQASIPDVYYCSQQNRPNCAEAVELTVACCLSGGCQDLTEFQCCVSGGQVLGRDTTCQNSGFLCEPSTGACRETQDDYLPENLLQWSADVCHPLILLPYIRQPHEYPAPEDWGDFEPGFVEFLSVFPTRAVDVTAQQLHQIEEVCAYHIAHPIIHHGFLKAAFCSNPRGVTGNQEPQMTLANPAINRQTEKPQTPRPHRPEEYDSYIIDYIESGSWYFIGAVHLPYVSEVQYHSQHIACGGPDV